MPDHPQIFRSSSVDFFISLVENLFLGLTLKNFWKSGIFPGWVEQSPTGVLRQHVLCVSFKSYVGKSVFVSSFDAKWYAFPDIFLCNFFRKRPYADLLFRTSSRSWKKNNLNIFVLAKVRTYERSASLWNFNPKKTARADKANFSQ